MESPQDGLTPNPFGVRTAEDLQRKARLLPFAKSIVRGRMVMGKRHALKKLNAFLLFLKPTGIHHIIVGNALVEGFELFGT